MVVFFSVAGRDREGLENPFPDFSSSIYLHKCIKASIGTSWIQQSLSLLSVLHCFSFTCSPRFKISWRMTIKCSTSFMEFAKADMNSPRSVRALSKVRIV